MSFISNFKLVSVASGALLLAACAANGSSSSSDMGADVGPIAGSQEDLVANVGDRVFFAFDRYDLNATAQSTLQRQAAWLDAHPTVTLLVEGHCDERGTREYNLALGARRANAAKGYLVSLGADPARATTISYGKERPVALGHNEESWALNRRAVSVVVNGPTS